MSTIKKLGQYKDIQVTVKRHTVSAEEIDQQLQSLLNSRPLFIDKEGPVENGDLTTIDFEGYKDGVAFDGGTAQGHQLEIGSGQFIPGFEEQMIGMEKGEVRDLNVTFPAQYYAPDLAGADVVFKVTVHNIQTKQPAVLDDAFVKGLNIPEVENVEQLRAYTEQYLRSQHQDAYQRDVENAIFDVLLKNSEVEVDAKDVQAALDVHINYLRQELAQQGATLEQYLQMIGATLETLQQQLFPSAKQQAQFEALIDAVVEAENISTTDEEADQQLDQLAQSHQTTKENILKQIDPESIKKDLDRIKASQLIIQSAVINEE